MTDRQTNERERRTAVGGETQDTRKQAPLSRSPSSDARGAGEPRELSFARSFLQSPGRARALSPPRPYPCTLRSIDRLSARISSLILGEACGFPLPWLAPLNSFAFPSTVLFNLDACMRDPEAVVSTELASSPESPSSYRTA